MAIERWSPFREFLRWERSPFPAFAARPRAYRPFAYTGGWSIPVDVERDGEDIVIRGALPGVRPEDIDVTIEDDVLTLAGKTAFEDERGGEGYIVRERRAGEFRRSVRLPDGADVDRAESRYEHGVVTVRVPVAESRKARRLSLAVGEEAPAPAEEAPAESAS